MDKNRKIVVSILILLVLSSVLAIIDISLSMQGAGREGYHLRSPGTGPGVGIVRIYGPIAIDTAGGGPFGITYGSDAIVQRLDDLSRDARIKAIVVRINSPGGTVAATQEIYDKIMRLRKDNVVVVASMGELAASGGYYVASACNYILANHGSITGSIGVIAVSPNLKGLFEKLGIRMNVIKSGRYKDLLSSYRDISQEERELIQEIIDSSYKKFLADVSLGRNIPIPEIEPVADGRVMSGETALRHRLVDELGSFETALDKARALAKLPDDAPVYDEVTNPIERFLMSLQGARGGIDIRVDRQVLSNLPAVEYRYQP
jgi:protease-4